MEPALKEKLIEIVRNHECLYNTEHKKYKNKRYKFLLWQRIGTMLDIDANKAKETWRSLRDGYVRYKKNIVGISGSSRKYKNYTWSAQMAFLDDTLELRSPSTNITAPQEDGSQSPESRSSFPPTSPQQELFYIVKPPSPETLSSASSIQLPLSNSKHAYKQSLSPSAERSVRKRTTSANLSAEEMTDNILEDRQDKKRRRHEYDDMDHLFASYAKSFKKLSRRTQAELKVNLAKLFAEAEITELDGDVKINESYCLNCTCNLQNQ